jgi:hypothetical protein
MAVYGTTTAVKQLLSASGSLASPDADARIEAIRAFVSARLERDVGATFGAPVVDTTEVHWQAGGPVLPDVLHLNRPARAITGIAQGGTVAGATITDQEAVPIGSWAVHIRRADGLILAIATAGSWVAPVQVTGDFADTDADADVPADVTYCVNFTSAQQFKTENASAAGFISAEGERVFAPDPFRTDVWRRTVAAHRVRPRRRVAV